MLGVYKPLFGKHWGKSICENGEAFMVGDDQRRFHWSLEG